MATPFLILDNISVRLRDRLYLQGTSWRINRGESWAVLGPNGSGKSTLARTLTGEVPVVRGEVSRHYASPGWREPLAMVSPDMHRDLMARENLLDCFRDFSGKGEGTKVKEMLGFNGDSGAMENFSADEEGFRMLARSLGATDLLLKDLGALSTGEMRKALILRALLKRPELLILDEPFEGLDGASRQSISAFLRRMIGGGMQVVLITHREEEIPPEVSHVLILDGGRVLFSGRRDEAVRRGRMGRVAGLAVPGFPREEERKFRLKESAVSQEGRADRPPEPPLVDMRDVTVQYGGSLVLDGLEWVMKKGQNWAILGPNGAGKSTVVELITGDNLQAYANRIFLFGRKKGSGESVWEIKRRIGVVSSELQVREYPEDMSVYEAVCSGFFDSFGLYRRCSEKQKEAAGEWIEAFGMEELSDRRFGLISTGQRQMVLIARSMVKSPDLLILDEPCSGLDTLNRSRILRLIEQIGTRTETDLIYITHQEREVPSCITHVLRLASGKVVERRALRNAG